MKTLLNNKTSDKTWSQYYKLFDEAEQILGLEPESINSLNQYLYHIQELVAEDSKFLLLPIDEEPFEINANTREITVPPAFASCSGVQNDNYCEIITFIIDRYFDYKDLDKSNIIIQWQNAAGKKGVSPVFLKELETYGAENKIRFGWPLTKEMTEVPGNLKFSVRFYDEGLDENNNKVYMYLFNTTAKTIPIKSTLVVDPDAPDTIVNDNDYINFKSFITNSTNPAHGVPTEVLWEVPLETSGNVNRKSDSKTIYAKAKTKDRNPITYAWYKKDLDADDFAKGTLIQDLSNADMLYEIKTEFKPCATFAEWPKERPAKYAYTTLWTQEAEGMAMTEVQDWPKTAVPLFVECSALTIKGIPEETVIDNDTDITGYYYVEGTNESEARDKKGKAVNSTSSMTGPCLFARPDELSIDKNLNSYLFYTEGSKLTLKLVKDNGNPTRTYSLTRKIDEETTTLISDGNVENDTIVYNLPAPTESDPGAPYGEYEIVVNSILNRYPTTITSIACDVCAIPALPEGAIDVKFPTGQDSIPFQGLSKNHLKINSNKQRNICILDTGVAENQFHGYDLGQLSYKWYVSEKDSMAGFIEIKAPKDPNYGNINTTDVNGPTLQVVTGHVEENDQTSLTYKCTVTNTLHGKNTSQDFLFTII